MPDTAQINRSLGTIRTELEYLVSSGALTAPQLQSIQAQLPQPDGQPSQYIDPKYVDGRNHFNPALVAQQAQDPEHPAHPNHPKHHEWAGKLAKKFGNAAVFGAGATFGSNLVNEAFQKF
ncbi:glycosyl hydrolase family 16 [Stemphylium lycopersici]|nr:glycosyl hydrolase family 16 [Stemphylium lycopersici]RAR10033.1 glycosyl hydrolase family 16 [Stemphylium lycopersici]